MRKLTIMIIFILLGCLIPGMTALAVGEDGQQEGTTTENPVDNIDYTGPVDIITGNPVHSDGTGNNYINISENVQFNTEDREYVYYLSGNTTISSNVADGMVVTDAVTLTRSGDMNASIYKDGKALSEIPSKVTEPGNYVVVTFDNNNEKQLFSFRIVNEITGKINYYVLPAGFTARNVTYEDKPIAHGYGTIDLMNEGHYIINYVCTVTNTEYKLDVTIDHTPPEITFEGLDEENNAKGPVTISGMSKDDTISILFNDEEAVSLDSDNQVSETGYYHVVITDPAGNSVEKDFRILLYLNVSATLFIIAFSLVIVGVIVALYIARKRLRVR